MLRRSRAVLFADAPLCVRVHSDVLAWDFPDADSFHKGRPGYLQDLYSTTTKGDAFSKVIRYQHREVRTDASGKLHETVGGYRYMVAAPVTIGNVCKRVPFLVDTGAPKTHLHTITLNKFLGENAVVSNAVLRNVFIGHHKMQDGVLVNEATTQHGTTDIPAWLGYLNLLGSDFLSVALPELERYMSENLSKFQPPLAEVWVTDGAVSFPVMPEKPSVAHLKQAIKAKLGTDYTGSPARITIKHPNGTTMGDEDPLHANIKYTFEVPSRYIYHTQWFS